MVNRKKIKIIWAQQVVYYMMKNKKEEACILYGNLVTKILEEIGYNFGDEKFNEEPTKIRKYVLPSMKYEIVNEGVTEKYLSNEKKRIANTK